jgi:hypothetical protein
VHALDNFIGREKWAKKKGITNWETSIANAQAFFRLHFSSPIFFTDSINITHI